MNKRRFSLLIPAIFLFTSIIFAQQTNTQVQTITQSGQSATFLNSLNGSTSLSAAYAVSGSPDTLSVKISGQTSSGSVQNLDSYTGTSDTTLTISLTSTYSYFFVAATWIGGNSVQVKATLTVTGPGPTPPPAPVPTFTISYSTDPIGLSCSANLRANYGGNDYYCSSGAFAKTGSGTGTGNVVGPPSATDNHLAVFDGATGKIIKDGGVVPTGALPDGTGSELQKRASASTFGAVGGSATGTHGSVSIAPSAEDASTCTYGTAFCVQAPTGAPAWYALGPSGTGFFIGSDGNLIPYVGSETISAGTVHAQSNGGGSGYVNADTGYQVATVPLASTHLSDTADLLRSSGVVRHTYVAGAGGTTANTLVKLALDGTVVAVSGTEGILGIAESTQLAAANVVVDLIGPSTCVIDGTSTITAGDYLIAGTTTPADCLDSGQTALANISVSTRIVGKASASGTGGSGATVAVNLLGAYKFGSKIDSVNAASVPASKTIVGTNSSGQIVDASSATLSNNTTGNATTATNALQVYNILGAGGVADGQFQYTCAIAASSVSLYCPGATFTSADAGKAIEVDAAGAKPSTPINSTFTDNGVGTGTLLHSHTYYYVAVSTATGSAGQTLPSTETSIATGSGADTHSVTLTFTVTAGSGCLVGGRTTGGELLFQIPGAVSGTTCTFTDTGAWTPVLSLPGSATAAFPLITTIASLGADSHHVNLTGSSTTAVTSSGIVVYGTDNTPALQNLINSLVPTSGICGGHIYAPAGGYVFASALVAQGQGNTLLYLPSNGLNGNCAFKFEGAVAESGYPQGSDSWTPNFSQTVFYAMTAASGTNPALLSMASNGGDIRNTSVELDHLRLRTRQNPDYQMAQLGWASNVQTHYVTVEVNSIGNPGEPTNPASLGIQLPFVDNHVHEVVESTTVTGFYAEYTHSENVKFIDTTAQFGVYCMEPSGAANLSSYVVTVFENCIYGVSPSSGNVILQGSMDVQEGTAGNWWQTIADLNGSIYGHLSYACNNCSGINHPIITSGTPAALVLDNMNTGALGGTLAYSQLSGSPTSSLVTDLGTLTYNASGNTVFNANSTPVAGAGVVATHATSTTFVAENLVTRGIYTLGIFQDSTGGGVTFTLGTSGSSCTYWRDALTLTAGAVTLNSQANAINFMTWTFDGYGCTITSLSRSGTYGTIASGTLALATSTISHTASPPCQTVSAGTVNSAAAPGVLTTDRIEWTPNGSLTGATGYIPSTAGGLSIVAYSTAGYVNFDVCNWTGADITPSAVTVNWGVIR